jgi:hypothetical protein
MGLLSVAKHLASQARKHVARAVHNPAGRVKRGVVRAVLKSSMVNSAQNALLRCVAGEILLAGAILVATALTASADSPVYNFVAPCIVSAACTEFLREPLNSACDVYTQPVADRLQRVVARRWYDESFWFGVKGCVGVTLGTVVVTLSYFNDVQATTIFVCQSLLTSMCMGIAKNPRHPVRGWAKQAMHLYLDRPRTTRMATHESVHDHFVLKPQVASSDLGASKKQGGGEGGGEEDAQMSEWYGGALDVIGGACLTALDQLAAGGTGAAVDAWNFDVCDEKEHGGHEGEDDDMDTQCRGVHNKPVAHAIQGEARLEEEAVHSGAADNDTDNGMDQATVESVQVRDLVEAARAELLEATHDEPTRATHVEAAGATHDELAGATHNELAGATHDELAGATSDELAEATVADVTMHLLSQGNITRTLQAEVLRVLQGQADSVACSEPAAPSTE